MIDYVLLVAPLEKEGYSDIQISSILSSVTARDIPAAQLENFLGDQGLANRNPVTGSWQGALIDLMEQGGELGEGLEDLFSHLNKPRSVCIETSKHPWCEKASVLLSALYVESQITEAEIAEIYKMAGGKLFPNGVTKEEVVSARVSRENIDLQNKRRSDIESILDEIRTRFIFPSVGSDMTLDQIRESIKQEL